MQDYNSAFVYIAALTQGDPASTVVDFRCIHETNKGTAAIPRRGTLPELWNELCNWNNAGYGVHACLNQMDGHGREITNVQYCRVLAVDLDNLSARQNYDRAVLFNPPPSFAVMSSPEKFHVYWQTTYHTNRDGFTLLQRKLRTLFDGDKNVIQAAQTLRLPGTYHLKNPAAPHLITVWQLPGYGRPIDPSFMEIALAGVNVIDGAGGRHDLGEPSLQAPGYDWCIKALDECDPNSLDRGDWISFTSAFKQAAWNYAPEPQLLAIWLKWCERYNSGKGNDPAENLKNWNSIRNTEVGWPSIERRNGNLHALRLFGEKAREYQATHQPQTTTPPMPQQPGQATTPPMPEHLAIPSSEFLTDTEQKEYFKGCIFIERSGEILTPFGRFMNATKFNGTYGGRNFVISSGGKTTTEAWQAATRSTLWTIPKADHTRFLPDRPQGEFVKDALGRVGVNTFRPVIVDASEGDITPFLRNMEMILPSEYDRKILFDYMAHVVKYPGFKIPWAPFIQSVQGTGKGLIKQIMRHAVGGPYTYYPTAKELVDSGSKFNAWMRARLFILVDEIRVDERRDMIDVLKPMISEKEIEIQGKGVDQEMEDNTANWCFFSNFKDAIPVDKNDRRFSINYSAIQSIDDLTARGMNDAYFTNLYRWADNGGAAYVTHWLLNYQIERGTIPMRAPVTTSTGEAVKKSRGPVETTILDAITDGLQGFRGGWISSIAVNNRLRGTTVRQVSGKTLATILEGLGYHFIGRAPRAYLFESKEHRSDLYHADRSALVEHFGSWQGYDV